jgi:nucleotide-binding universal stress UspA family protein
MFRYSQEIMKRFKRILLVLDGDTPVTAILPWCRTLAEASSAEGVDVLWCREPRVPEYPGLDLPEMENRDDDGGEAVVTAMQGLPVKVIDEEGGRLKSALHRLAGGTYDLVIVSVHDQESRNLAERLARKSPVGVLALPPGSVVPPSKIRLGVDLSNISALCLEWAEAFATLGAGTGTDLEAMHVMVMPRGGRATMAIDPETLRQHVTELARTQLESFFKEHSRDPERWRPVFVDGQAASEALMRRTGDPTSELLVVGCHGRNALSIALLGSHACDVIRRSESAVLVVKRKNENLGFLRELLGQTD